MDRSERGLIAAEKALSHYGKKGMKWGVRNDKGHEGEQVKTKDLAKLDKKWEKQNTGIHGYIKAHNAAADRMNNVEIDRFNEDPRWKKVADEGLLHDDRHPETQAYFKAYEDLCNKVMAEEGAKLGMNPSGTKRYEMREDEEGNPYAYLAPVKKDVQHAEGDTEQAFKINRDAAGLVKDMYLTELELKHYGVKGMKWGVSRAERKSAKQAPSEVTVIQKKPGTPLTAKGGKNQPASEDAQKAATARQKAKASSVDALSNAELKSLVERMNLEANYTRLSATRKSAGKQFIEKLFTDKKTRDQTAAAASKALDVASIPFQVGNAIKRTDLSKIGT